MFGQGTTRSINAIFSLKSYLPFDVLPAWQPIRAPAARRAEEEAARSGGAPRSWSRPRPRMKPRDNVFQGGGAATTDPRKPDYANLFAMKGVDWDDPTVDQLAKARGQHPVEVMIDLSLANENQVYVQPLVNESPDDVLGILKHPRTLATFSDSGAHVCQEMGSSLQTHLLSYWVRKRGAFTLEQAIKKLTHDNAAAWELNDRGLVREGLSGPTSCCSRRTASGRACRRSRRTCPAAPAAWCRRPRASRPRSSTAPWRSRTARRPAPMPARC